MHRLLYHSPDHGRPFGDISLLQIDGTYARGLLTVILK